MSDPILKLQLVVRAELALAEIRARRTATRSALSAVALLFLLLGLAMMTLSLYNALQLYMSPAWAAFCVSIVDILLGGVFIVFAKRAGPSKNEEKLAREMREMAYAELGSDVQEIKDEFNRISSEISRIRSGISSFTGGAVSSIGPLVNLLAKTLKR